MSVSPWRRGWGAFLFTVVLVFPVARGASLNTRNVFLIVTDGLRWQEVFRGAEARLMTTEHGGVSDSNALRAAYWRETPEARRDALLPFFWSRIARLGQFLGNQDKHSVVTLTNGRKFSYPGYNEILTGVADSGIDSDAKRPNPNVTVFEWLNGRPRLRDRVAVFATWDVFPYIFNLERSGLPIWPGWEPRFQPFEIRAPAWLVELRRDTTELWAGVTYDSFLFHATKDYLIRKRPRLLFIGFGETDEWAHAGRYDHYLNAAHRVDDFVRRLWETAQSLAQYRDKTTFLITTDHGRGGGASDWKDHGEDVVGAEGIWLAAIGPDTAPLGERAHHQTRTQSQIAATVAALLGDDFHAAFPNAGAPMTELFAPPGPHTR